MRTHACGAVVILLSGMILGGCAEKIAVITDVPVVPAEMATPDANPVVPEEVRPAAPPPKPANIPSLKA